MTTTYRVSLANPDGWVALYETGDEGDARNVARRRSLGYLSSLVVERVEDTVPESREEIGRYANGTKL
jgi:hypothetical protein